MVLGARDIRKARYTSGRSHAIPLHNTFLSAAQGLAGIDAALQAASHGFKAVAALKP
ncbi:MAG TPA: hypothetical protein VJR30_23510 [Bradyrhizobium sp.]|nr:hypothetical protein [Bradyrhizobium sp.]